ncbi:formyltransferase family protein [Cupriavidus taiwanensis]|uniref:formyltransferase family protein n=1 Tax=Cupriavidus taiwanensis TaxID=164546 RepID=UPI0039C1C70F
MTDKLPRDGTVGFLADQDVGLAAVRYVLENHPRDIRYVVTTGDNEIAALCRTHQCRVICADGITDATARELLGDVDLMILAWWPRILPKSLIEIPRRGVVNFHPSWLPYNRGKHYNFWTIVEDTPFGVSLHLVNEDVDQGDILFQSRIEKSWEDDGGSLYHAAKRAMVALFEAHYEDLVTGNYAARPQDLKAGSFHLAKELDPASEIFLDKSYQGRELLNLLRARTFTGNPSCYFHDGGKKYEVRISIKEVKDGAD